MVMAGGREQGPPMVLEMPFWSESMFVGVRVVHFRPATPVALRPWAMVGKAK